MTDSQKHEMRYNNEVTGYITRNHLRVLVILEDEKKKAGTLKRKNQQQVVMSRSKFTAFLHLFTREAGYNLVANNTNGCRIISQVNADKRLKTNLFSYCI